MLQTNGHLFKGGIFMKKILVGLLTTVLFTGAFCVTGFAAQEKATPSAAKVNINERQVGFQAYNIKGNTYFKLRDISAALYGTDAGFKTEYDSSKNAIVLTKGAAYISDYKIDSTPIKNAKDAKISSQKVMLNDKEVDVTAYNIDGYNYFKLRDLGDALGFKVAWDNISKTIVIQSQERLPAYNVQWENGTKTTYIYAIFNVEGYGDTEFATVMIEEDDGSLFRLFTKYVVYPDGGFSFDNITRDEIITDDIVKVHGDTYTKVENYFDTKIDPIIEALYP